MGAEAGGLAEDGTVCASGWVVFAGPKGDKVSGNVARFAAAGSVGRYRAPCWPQADRLTALMPRIIALTRIRRDNNMVKL